MSDVTTIEGCVLGALPLMEAASIHMCATSPPFWGLRVYPGEPSHWPAVRYAPMAGLPEVEVEAWTGQLGMESTPEMFVGHLVTVFRLVRRVLRGDGTLWLNMGDSFCGSGASSGFGKQQADHFAYQINTRRVGDVPGLKAKDLVGIPWRVAFALQADGWWLRSELIWAKGVSFCDTYAGSVMPESVTDRPTRSHEQVFLLTKKARYYYDNEAVKEKIIDPSRIGEVRGNNNHAVRDVQGANRIAPGAGIMKSLRNLRSVWLINPEPSTVAHYAGWPSRLVAPMIRAGTSERGVCPACAAPWERVVERTTANPGQPPGYNRDCGARNDGDRAGHWVDTSTKNIGWRPTCSCEAAEPVPATVLDIFAGTGTTADVARRLGRCFIMIDRSAAYVEMQHKRLAQGELF